MSFVGRREVRVRRSQFANPNDLRNLFFNADGFVTGNLMSRPSNELMNIAPSPAGEVYDLKLLLEVKDDDEGTLRTYKIKPFIRIVPNTTGLPPIIETQAGGRRLRRSTKRTKRNRHNRRRSRKN